MSAVAHQMLSAGKGKNAVREFLESHRMGHLLQHEDLHKTLEHLSPPLPGMKKTSVSLAVNRFTKHLHTAKMGAPERTMTWSGPLHTSGPRPGSVQSAAPAKGCPSARLRCRSSFTSVTGTWGPPTGAKAVSLLTQRASAKTDATGSATVADSRSQNYAAAKVSGTANKHEKAGLEAGHTLDASGKIGAWNCALEPGVRLAKDPRGIEAAVETRTRLAGVGRVSFSRDCDARECGSQGDPSVLRGCSAGAGSVDEYPSAMEGIQERRSANRGGEPCTQERAHSDRMGAHKQDEAGSQQAEYPRPQDAAGLSHISGAQPDIDTGWDAPEDEIISGFLKNV